MRSPVCVACWLVSVIASLVCVPSWTGAVVRATYVTCVIDAFDSMIK